MNKSETIMKLRDLQQVFRNTLDKSEKHVSNCDGISEMTYSLHYKYKSACGFFDTVIEKIENDYVLKDALFSTIIEKQFMQSFTRPSNPIEHGLFLYELEGIRIAFFTIKKDFNLIL